MSAAGYGYAGNNLMWISSSTVTAATNDGQRESPPAAGAGWVTVMGKPVDRLLPSADLQRPGIGLAIYPGDTEHDHPHDS